MHLNHNFYIIESELYKIYKLPIAKKKLYHPTGNRAKLTALLSLTVIYIFFLFIIAQVKIAVK